VNAVRGRLLQAFAKAEWSVSETLVALVEAHGAKNVPLRMMVGQRHQDLADAFAACGVRPYPAGVAALDSFRRHDPLRNTACHGV